ncbi:MAG TPA: alpha/beta hydrolase family protein [Solirubrobacterales bacterium]|nr:alpha/beta hydrolase family protein [Solirubrobacterales bacterium]
MRRRGRLASRLAVVIATAAIAALAASPARAADHDITVVSSQQLDSRLVQLQLSTPVLKSPTGVRILLPADYDEHPDQRYPVLYLLHGAQGQDTDWTTVGDAEAITAGAPLIVVMPDGGQGGWYTNWVNRGAFGPPEWETYHVDELIPWVDDHYRTIAARDGRAIAGLSMGGFGAMSYASRHPDLFAWAGTFSGAVDITHDLPVVGAIAATAFLDGGLPGDQFGNRLLNDANWQAHDPWTQAPHLRGMALEIDTGNGAPGPYDTSPLGDPLEEQVHEMSVSFHNRLVALGIPSRFDDYGPGTHSWPYWQRDLRRALPSVLATLAGPAG